MRALAYLEWRFVLHQAAAIGRSPLRLAIWIPYAISLLYLAGTRLFGSHGMGFGSMELGAGRLTGIGGLYLGALGITIALSAGGRVSAFRSNAEAVLFSNAGVAPLQMAVWLQLRKLVASGLRWSGALIYYFLIFFPRHASPLGAAVSFLTALLAVALLMSVELPIFLLSRGNFNTGIRIFGWTLAAAGLAYTAVGFSGQRIWAVAIGAVRVDPGGVVRSIQSGSVSALTTFCALLGVLLIAIAALAHDSLPELYAVSRRSLAETRRRQSAVRQTRYGAVVSTSAARIPRGALALAWKDWIGFRRGNGSLALWLGGCAFWTACGAGAAIASGALDDRSPMVSLAVAVALLLVFFAPHGASVGLAGDLGKPIFWLGRDPLRSRLAAWTLGRAARGGVAIGLAPMFAGLVFHAPLLAILALPFCLAAYWSLQGLGVGLYALFPNAIDARGPMALLRMLVTVVYVMPALLAGGIAAALGGGAIAAFATSAVMFIAEGAIAIELASQRFSERGAAMALASNA